MAKFYQHFSPEDNVMGKVVKLKYIDDISDDDFVLFYFSDGTKCNKDFIGAVDVDDPMMQRCVMVEVLSPAQKWSLEKKTIELKETIRVWNEEEQRFYEAPGETINVNNGENMTKAKDGSVRIDAIPPQLPRRWTVEPEEDYLLSLHPELETVDMSKPVQKVEAQKKNLTDMPVKKNETTVTNDKLKDNDTVVTEEYAIEDDFDKQIDAIYVPSFGDYINIDLGGKSISVTKDEFIERLTNERKPVVKEVQVIHADEDVIKNENILIKSMINMCKKKVCEISMDIDLELPPKEVYYTIKNSYTDELAAEFVNSLTARISINELLKSLAKALGQYYADGYTGDGV